MSTLCNSWYVGMHKALELLRRAQKCCARVAIKYQRLSIDLNCSKTALSNGKQIVAWDRASFERTTALGVSRLTHRIAQVGPRSTVIQKVWFFPEAFTSIVLCWYIVKSKNVKTVLLTVKASMLANISKFAWFSRNDHYFRMFFKWSLSIRKVH